MAYNSSNPPSLIAENIGGGGALWLYKSADDDGTVNGADYVANAGDLGMEIGDLVLVVDTATPKGSFHFVASIASGAATLAFGAVA